MEYERYYKYATVNSGGFLQMDLQQRSLKVNLKRIEPVVAKTQKKNNNVRFKVILLCCSPDANRLQ